jgi:hypothetical protein
VSPSLSTLSLDSIDLFLYDSLNDDDDRSSEDERLTDRSKNTLLLQTIANERHIIEQLTRRCSSLDSLENDHHHAIARSSKTIGMI